MQNIGNQEQCPSYGQPKQKPTKRRVSNGRRANPQYLTLADVNALLEQEREKISGIPKQFSWDPPFPSKLLSKPYPKGYESPKFHSFDGRNGSVVEHVSRFIHTIGPYIRNQELFLKEFAKSLVDRAFT